MDELELVNTNINFVFEFKTPNGYLPLGYNKYSLPINIFHNTENIYTTDYTIITNSMNNPSEYSARNASYPIALLERGKHIHRVLLKDLNEETINPNEIYVLCFESFYVEVSDRGLNHLVSQDAQTVSNQARTDAKTEVLKKATILEEKLRDYVNQQYMEGSADYTLYRDSSNVFSEKKFIGGFLADSEPIEKRYRSQYRRFE
jgi:hypothetical protein